MAKRCSEWPDPWVRRRLSPFDERVADQLCRDDRVTPRDRQFVRELELAGQATLQQVAWLRTLGKRYKALPPEYQRMGDRGKTRRIILGGDDEAE